MNHLKGVNLGGWLVLEKWMTPSVFKGTDAKNEYELAGTDRGRRVLKKHHQTFITEGDFRWLRDKGYLLIRLPVGHWVFGDAPPYVGAVKQLDFAFQMAEKYDLQILLDLHGAPGAQNAADHSGSGRPGLSAWLDSPDKKEATIHVLERLVERYNPSEALWGIELVNEPLADRFGFKLVRFYRRTYRRLTKIAKPGLYIVFSDGFNPLFITGALPRSKLHPVAIDCHFYQCFGRQNKQLSFEQHLRKARWRHWLIRFLGLWQPVIVGEWSAMLPFRPSPELTQQYFNQQQIIHQEAIAQCYWNYKTEAGGRWNLRDMLE